MDSETETHHKSVALIMGVTGMVGLSLLEALKNPTALGGPWKVYGVARRPKPTWFPSSTIDRYISFDAVSKEETHHHLSSISTEVTHLFWVAFQLFETEEANVSVNSAMLSNVLHELTSALNSPLKHVCLQTGTKQYMGPMKDVTHALRIVPADPPFREDSARLPFPNFYYALEDILSSYTPKLTWSVHRSSIIIGASSRSLHNTLLTLAVYAAICRYEGTPFRYPGTRYTWEHFCDMSDSGLLADQQIWAAVTDEAKNQAFNCTNGDVFMWKNMWKFLCEVFDVEYVALDENWKFDFAVEMKKKAKIWESIVEENGLEGTKLESITCPETLQSVMHFGFQHVCNMNKSREYGFLRSVDTFKSVRRWVDKLKALKIIPTT